MTGTGRSSACITKHPRSAFWDHLRRPPGGSGDSRSSVVAGPSISASIVSFRTAPLTRNRVWTRMVIRVTVTFRMCPYRDTWVISQNASAALKYMRGVGAEPSPPRLGPSSHANVM